MNGGLSGMLKIKRRSTYLKKRIRKEIEDNPPYFLIFFTVNN